MSRGKELHIERKKELVRFIKTYFDSFGWSWREEDNSIFVKMIGEYEKELICVDTFFEEYPTTQDIKKILLKGKEVIVVSSEYSPKMRKNKFCYQQHTASGINFNYFKQK